MLAAVSRFFDANDRWPLAGPLLLGSLVMMPAHAEAKPPASYNMVGTEPFWSLAIDRRTMTFELMDMPKVVQNSPKARKTK